MARYEGTACAFHAFCQVKCCTTSRPKLQAGIELYGPSKDLLGIKTLFQAELRVEHFMQWCGFWSDFLAERTRVDGRFGYTHERLRKARGSLAALVDKGTLFAYLDPELAAEGPLPATNNRTEGGINARLRSVLRSHRGMSLVRRIKAVYRWCYMHTECPKPPGEILRSMPTDDDIDLLYGLYAIHPSSDGEPAEWGEGLAWSEFHHETGYPYSVD